MAARHASELELLRFDDEFEGDIRLNEPMARHTTYRIGGPAHAYAQVNSIAALAKSEGKAVGVTTSVSVDHATPASFYAHVKDRNMYHQIGKDLIAAGFDFYAGSDFLQPENNELSGNKDLYTQCREGGGVCGKLQIVSAR